jgi:hypothetical protein
MEAFNPQPRRAETFLSKENTMSSIFKPEVSKTDRNTGKKVKTKTKKWYGRYRDENGKERRVPLSENKATAQQMLAERVKQVERIKSGQIHSAKFYFLASTM